jgi:hypothetical protein
MAVVFRGHCLAMGLHATTYTMLGKIKSGINEVNFQTNQKHLFFYFHLIIQALIKNAELLVIINYKFNMQLLFLTSETEKCEKIFCLRPLSWYKFWWQHHSIGFHLVLIFNWSQCRAAHVGRSLCKLPLSMDLCSEKEKKNKGGKNDSFFFFVLKLKCLYNKGNWNNLQVF